MACATEVSSQYSTATAGFGYQLFKELFYYMGMNSAKHNETVTVFGVFLEVSITQMLLAMTV